MKYLHRLAGIAAAFCIMIVLFITSVEAVVYGHPDILKKNTPNTMCWTAFRP